MLHLATTAAIQPKNRASEYVSSFITYKRKLQNINTTSPRPAQDLAQLDGSDQPFQSQWILVITAEIVQHRFHSYDTLVPLLAHGSIPT